MSVLIDMSKMDSEVLRKIDTDLNLDIVSPKDFGGKKTIIHIEPYRVLGNLAWIPFAYAWKRNLRPVGQFSSIPHELIFKGVLREEQKIVRNEAIDLLNRNGSVILSTHVGFGKSILATYFAYKIKLRTLIVVNRLSLIEQWVKVLHDFIENPQVQVLKSQEVKNVDWTRDFFIINAINIPKMGYTPEIGLVIVDEVHLIMSKVLSQGMQYLTPRYMIGLSATPYRPDGLDKLIDLYFGEEKIDRQLQRKHFFFKVNTGFVPTLKLQTNRKVDWNNILEQQALNEARNDLIVQIISKYTSNNFLVLCKRVEQIKILEQKLLLRFENTENTSVLALYGDKQPEPGKEFRVLIGTIQKLGTGFDAPYLNALLLAADVEEYFIQYLGRVFRKTSVVPIIFDLVDSCKILEKHYRTREATYRRHGGVERNFNGS